MNKQHVLFHLHEAHQQLIETIEAMEQDPDYEFGDFMPDMSHLYHHINTAWNSQDASVAKTEECTETDFNRWRLMPTNEELLLLFRMKEAREARSRE